MQHFAIIVAYFLSLSKVHPELVEGYILSLSKGRTPRSWFDELTTSRGVTVIAKRRTKPGLRATVDTFVHLLVAKLRLKLPSHGPASQPANLRY